MPQDAYAIKIDRYESLSMSLATYRTLGRSGLVVSPLALGTMTFGTPRWGIDEAGARAIFDAYVEAGGNLVDTADIYAGGASEGMIGRLIAERGLRDRIVLATKFGFNAEPGNPHAGGCGAKNVRRALEGSLGRLGVESIDLYWMHVWDGVTPVEEIVQTLGDLVRAGLIRYWGLSDMPAWMAAKAATLASERGVPGPIACQLEYSLVARDVEREHVAAAREGGMGLVPWSPLAGGFLTGKYDRAAVEARGDVGAALPDAGGDARTDEEGRLSGANPFGSSKFTERNWAVLDVLGGVAREQDRTCAQVALAWVMGRPGVDATLIGASRVSQLEANLAAAEIVLTSDQEKRLEEAGALEPGFSDMLTSPRVRQMIFGGHAVEDRR